MNHCPFCYETHNLNKPICDKKISRGWYCDRPNRHLGKHVGCVHNVFPEHSEHCVQISPGTTEEEILIFTLTKGLYEDRSSHIK